MSGSDKDVSCGLSQVTTARLGRVRRHRHSRPRQRPRFRCVASPTSSSPSSTSGSRPAGCLYRKIRVRTQCTSIKMSDDRCRCDVIDHVVELDYFKSMSVDLNHRHPDDVVVSSSADSSNSSSPTHDVIMSSYSASDINRLSGDDETGTENSHGYDDAILSSSTDSSDSSLSAHCASKSMISGVSPRGKKTGSGNLRHVEIVLRYEAGRLGVAVGGVRPVKVKVVRQGGEGQLAGLAVGDEIIDVEGREVSHAKPEVVASLLRSWTGDTLHLTVARPERDDSGHASSSSLSSPDDVTDNTSGYSCLPKPRDANYCAQQSTSGKHRIIYYFNYTYYYCTVCGYHMLRCTVCNTHHHHHHHHHHHVHLNPVLLNIAAL